MTDIEQVALRFGFEPIPMGEDGAIVDWPDFTNDDSAAVALLGKIMDEFCDVFLHRLDSQWWIGDKSETALVHSDFCVCVFAAAKRIIELEGKS
jgi:hypothetical protein